MTTNQPPSGDPASPPDAATSAPSPSPAPAPAQAPIVDVGALVQANPTMTGGQIAAVAQVLSQHPSLGTEQAAVLARAGRPDLWAISAPAPAGTPPAPAPAPAVLPTPPPVAVSPSVVLPPQHQPPELPADRNLREAREFLASHFQGKHNPGTLPHTERQELVVQGLRALDRIRAAAIRERAASNS